MSDPPNKNLMMESFETRLNVQSEMIRLQKTENDYLKNAIGPLLELKDELLRHSGGIHLCDPQIQQSLLSLNNLFRSQPEVFKFVPEKSRNFSTSTDLTIEQNNTVKQRAPTNALSSSNLKLNKFNLDPTSSTAYLSRQTTNSKAISNNVSHLESDDVDVDNRNLILHKYAYKETQSKKAKQSKKPKEGNLIFIDANLRDEAQSIVDMETQTEPSVTKHDSLKSQLKIDQDDDEEEEAGHQYCICKKASNGNMICCDNQNCPSGMWFHFACVGITSQLVNANDQWFCPVCSVHLQIKGNQHPTSTNAKHKPKCRVCGKTFRNQSNLLEHTRTHKLYRCVWPDCSYATTKRCNGIRHVRTRHFGLPQTQLEQDRRKIVDNRDPNQFIQSTD